MTPADLEALGLRVRPLAFSDGGRIGGFRIRYATFDISAGFSGYYTLTQEAYGLASVELGVHCNAFGATEIWKGPSAGATPAANAHLAAQVAAMIERYEE